MDIFIGAKVDPIVVNNLIDCAKDIDDGVLYVGFPVFPTHDGNRIAHATMISPHTGLVVFDVPQAGATSLDMERARDEIFMLFSGKLISNPSLVDRRALCRDAIPRVMTFIAASSPACDGDEYVWPDVFSQRVALSHPIDGEVYRVVRSTIERVGNLRSQEKRVNVTKDDSYGAALVRIEKEIANLDPWQNKASLENPAGPQRIRGLAGSGKTIVLASKASYLHVNNPEWNIVVTFHTQALYGQFKGLIQRFYYEDTRSDFDPDHLQVMHSYGSSFKKGFYSTVCAAYNVPAKDFGYAKRTYGFNNAFAGVCAELLSVVRSDPRVLFDAVLIDEAQDLPKEFLQIAYHTTKDHRVVWAYDDLQTLGEYQIGSVVDIFGVDSKGAPLVDLSSAESEPRRDIILPVCYRNTPWALVAAHAFGAGVYRSSDRGETHSMIQHPDDPALWTDMGYEVYDGELRDGSPVSLRRATSSIPKFFIDILNKEDAVRLFNFDSDFMQLNVVADMIRDDILLREIHPHDVLVVFPEARTAANRGVVLAQHLRDRGISSHVAGRDYSRDVFLVRGSVTISGAYRAKGNETAMVYLLDAQDCASGPGLIKKRNTMFTAITRAKAWVRICGYGDGMRVIGEEFAKIVEKDFSLVFNVPTVAQRAAMKVQHRDISPEDERRLAEAAKPIAALVKAGLARELLDRLSPDQIAALRRELDGRE